MMPDSDSALSFGVSFWGVLFFSARARAKSLPQSWVREPKPKPGAAMMNHHRRGQPPDLIERGRNAYYSTTLQPGIRAVRPLKFEIGSFYLTVEYVELLILL